MVLHVRSVREPWVTLAECHGVPEGGRVTGTRPGQRSNCGDAAPTAAALGEGLDVLPVTLGESDPRRNRG